MNLRSFLPALALGLGLVATAPAAERAAEPAPAGSRTTDAVSIEQAIRIARDRHGGTVTSAGMDDHKGEPTWEVGLRGTPRGDIEVEVSRRTGEIVKVQDD